MATAMELAFQQAHAVTVYAHLGQTVTYEPVQGSASSIAMILDSASDPFADVFEAPTADAGIAGKVLRANVSTPSRGDRVTDAEGAVYEVDSYAEINAVEWSLRLRRCNG